MTTYDIEIGDNSVSSNCHCCGEESYNGHGFVYKNNDAYAVYYAGWSNHHTSKTVSFAIAIGEWEDGTTPADRTCFGVEAQSLEKEIVFRVIEPDESPWADTELLGQMINRDTGVSSSDLKKVFVILENIVKNHPAISQYLS